MASSRTGLGLFLLPLCLFARAEAPVGLGERLAALRKGQGLDGRHALVARSSHRDETGGTHVRVQQTYLGLKVFGGEAILHTDAEGRELPPTLALKVHPLLNPVPGLEVQEALALGHAHAAPRGAYTRTPQVELVVLPEEAVSLRPGLTPELANAQDERREVTGATLAYHLHFELENGAEETRHVDLLLNAHTGALLHQWESLEAGAVRGVGRSQHSGTVGLDTNALASGYELRDTTRGTGGTFGANVVTNLDHATAGNGTVYTDPDNTWGDGLNYDTSNPATTGATGQTAAVDAAYGLQATWDYYLKVHGRKGIDGTGKATYARVHYSRGFDNAFWSDACFCMTYGDGAILKTLTALDVAGHEMSHGVIGATAKLIYTGESGGLNEAHADIHGTLTEFHARGGAGTSVPNTATNANWTMGEQLTTPSFPNPLRWMVKPSKDGKSPDAWSSGLGALDVHYSSGPMNRAFYFLAQGAASTATSEAYSTYLPGGMVGVGNDHAARISYRALTAYMTATTTYAGARDAYIAAAKALYGAGSSDEQAVWNAFAAINVGGKWIPPDTTAPTVTVKELGTSGTITFTATATDNVGVAQVQFYVDGTLKGTATSSPYTLTLDSTTLTNGTHTALAKAKDAAGNLGTSASVSFTISNAKDTTAPVVKATESGTSGTITLSATATDNVAVTKVDFYVDGVLKGTDTTSPYALTLDSTPLANGAHTLLAKAYDAAGNVGSSGSVPFNLVKDTTAPTVTAKVTGTVGILTLGATATDNVSVTKVDFYVDGALKGSSTASPYSLAFDSIPLASGNHTLVAKATDPSGNVGTSPTVTFAVVKDTTAPTVQAKVTGTSGTLTLSATASDNVGVTKVEFLVDGTSKAILTALPYGLTLDSTTLANGSHTLVVKAWDPAGNVGSATVTFSVANSDPTLMMEKEANDTSATANVIGSLVKTVKGALATGSDKDTFALTLAAGQTVTLTFTPPAGQSYGLYITQGFAPLRAETGGARFTLTAPAQAATTTTFYIQVYSLNGQSNGALYTLTLQR